MPTPQDIAHALKNEVDSVIYARGRTYALQNSVLTWDHDTTTDPTALIHLSGTVRGTQDYAVAITYNPTTRLFDTTRCTCLYAETCKHVVALACVYVLSGMHPKEEPATPQPVRTSFIDTPSTTTKTFSSTFDPSNYGILLRRDHGYSPTFHHRNQYHEQASCIAPLQYEELTEKQRALLEYLKERKGVHTHATPATDVGVLFPLLAGEGFDILTGNHHEDFRQVSVDIDPPPIHAQLFHKKTVHPVDTEAVRHEIYLQLPDERAPGRGVARSLWYKDGVYMVHETDTRLRLYTLTLIWANLINKVQPMYESAWQSANEYAYHATLLTSITLETLPELCASAGPQIDLDIPKEIQKLTVHTDKPKLTLTVEYDSVENRLHVTPCAHYGAWQSDLSTNIARHYMGTRRYARRDSFASNKNFILTEKDSALHYTRLYDKEEIAFYKQLEKVHEELGFTKTLKCVHRGRGQTIQYIENYWPVLRAYAQEHDIAITFTKDTLPSESVLFRADFTSSEVDTDKDWLQFDVALYCGDERVTLDKLYAYTQSTLPYWRRDDGTMVEIENKKELDRLVRLLKNFQAKKRGSFTGKLYHAPELSYVITSSPHYNAVQTKSLAQFMRQVESGKPIKKVRLPAHIARTLRPYQKEGVQWIHFLRSYHFAGILADDMGLGKTIQALTVLYTERVEKKPSIVVCPKTLLYNWENEAKHFFPTMKTLVYDGNPDERAHMRKTLAQHNLIVLSYSTLKNDADLLFTPRRHFNYAVLDEAQYIKNHATKTAQCVKRIPAEYRLALTGTPLENNVSELWSMFDYLMPNFLGNYEYFNKQFHKPIMDAGDQDAMQHLRHKVGNFMLRRTKGEVLKELPPKIEQQSECSLSESQGIIYQQILEEVRGDVYSAVEKRGFRGAQIHILAGLTKLRQACNHPALLTKDKNYGAYDSAKLDLCMELVHEVIHNKRKVLIFSQFTGMLDILASTLKEQDIAYAYLSGKTRNRKEVIETFNKGPEIPVFLISLKAGGVGLNLTTADTVIIFDPWWNPSVENQAIDRTHRIGQTRTVNVHRLLARGTIEEKIQALKAKKQDLFNAVVEESGDMFKKLTWDDIRDLFVE